MQISRLQVTDPAHWAGFTDANHLYTVAGKTSQLVSDAVEQLYQVNLGSDDIVAYLDKFPVSYVEDENVPYRWLIQGYSERSIPLIKATMEDMSTAPSEAGKGLSTFYMHFAENYFGKSEQIVGHKPDKYALLILEDPINLGSTYAYKVQLVTGDRDLFIPATELTAGKKWSYDFGLVTKTLSRTGSIVRHSSPYALENDLSMIRKEAIIPGNLINFKTGENGPLAFKFVNDEGKPQVSWISKLDWDMLTQFRRDRSRLYMYGKSNKKPDGTFGNLGDSGYEIQSGFGLLEQVSSSNIFYYNSFTADWLGNIGGQMTYGKVQEDLRNFVLVTGEAGAELFHKAMEDKAAGITYLFNESRLKDQKGRLSLSGQFVSYGYINGIQYTVLIDPMKDDPIRNKEYGADGRLLSSKEFEIIDFGTANGKPNIQKVLLSGNRSDIYRYIDGFRSPYTMYNNTNTPTVTSSKVDGYELLRGHIGGVKINNPMRAGRLLPSEYLA